MRVRRKQIFAAALGCALAVSATQPATAQSSTPIGGVTSADVVWIGVAVGAIGAGIGVGIYYAVHHNHNLMGCAVSGTGGLELLNKSDQQTYSLVGAVTGIKPGERVRVSGKKLKKAAGPTPQFLVEQLSKDYGACPAKPVAP